MDNNVGADPTVDEVRSGRNQGDEDSSSERRQIGDDDLDDDTVNGISNLVENNTTGVMGHVLGGALDDGTNDVEGQTGDKELDSTKDIRKLSGNRLTGGTNDTLQDTHGGEQGVLTVRSGSVTL